MAAGSSNAAPGADSVTNNEGEAPRVCERREGCVFPSIQRLGALSIGGIFSFYLFFFYFLCEKEKTKSDQTHL